MKTVLSVLLVVCLAGTCMAQPPWAVEGKFGAGQGKFGDVAKGAQMHRHMRSVLVDKDKPEVAKRPGPPPWANKMRGPRGPQRPFHVQSESEGERPRHQVSRGGSDHRGRGWRRHRHQNNFHPRFQGRKFAGNSKNSNWQICQKCPCCKK